MKADEETIKGKVEIIDENIRFLEEEKQSFNPEDYSFKDIQSVKHSMFEIAEACIDIASHIIAAEGFSRPDEYSEMFTVLKRNEVIGEELGENMADMAGFRNFLVHRYDKVDPKRLQEFMEEDLQDVRNFVEEVYQYMDSN